ncbi:uncharacterized protein DNG_00776 [Cephalotrichum gorgonifer]|uniref:Uncharacterized protein n=1 Tax=Cephalotrichum gorgonifer TaxID=2041049 RepID=A0AAE8MPC5_9PEZI|nr:uncharacterized protein DNG_00776 [Cephalotrichum gorgonifer]
MPNYLSFSSYWRRTGFKGYRSLEWEGLDHIGTSSVRKLRLSYCGAHEAALKDLLSWPSALEELWYEADQGEWAPGFEEEGEEVPDYTTSAIERCLASQVGSLRKLVFSRPVQDHEGLGYSEGINLRRYEKLQSLSINHVFLIGFEDANTNVWERLPKSLVELDVFYDDSGYINFMENAERPGWLFDLLEKKQQFFPALEKVRILSCEGAGHDEDEAVGVQAEWSPGGDLVQAFVRADVSFTLYLNEKHRYEYVANGEAWDDDWEVTEDKPSFP